jgi:tetrahydromethanopterin S-methyltransferase subunit G
MKLKPLLVGAVIGAVMALLLPVLVVAVFNVRGPETEPTWPNLPLLVGAWVIALFAPAFCAAFVARRLGWLYGAVLGIVPITIAVAAKYELPLVLIIAFWVVAIAGGALGHLASRARHAL